MGERLFQRFSLLSAGLWVGFALVLGGSVTYVLYPDEGHGFARPENRIDFNARAEGFLGKCLGGRVEPMPGDRMPGSTAVVRVAGK